MYQIISNLTCISNAHNKPLGQDTSLCVTPRVPEESRTVRYPGSPVQYADTSPCTVRRHRPPVQYADISPCTVRRHRPPVLYADIDPLYSTQAQAPVQYTDSHCFSHHCSS